jgi:TRAP-type C4-dicarboxylate transport system permease large subunit
MRQGHDNRAVVGSLAGGGTLGPLLPPSVALLIFGALADTSIGRLIFAELGSLFTGLATPTEAAGVGVAATILLGATPGELTLARFRGALVSAARSFAVIAMVFAAALILAQAIALLGRPQQILRAIAAAGLRHSALLAVVVPIHLVLGLFFDGLSMMILTRLLVITLVTGVGFDPIRIRALVGIMMEISMLTPPVGVNLFVLIGVTRGEVPLAEAARGALPCWVCLLVAIGLPAVVAGLATWLPGVIYG